MISPDAGNEGFYLTLQRLAAMAIDLLVAVLNG
jgi:hypothetical protein